MARKPQAPRPADLEHFETAEPGLWAQAATRIGGSLTPAQVSAIIATADSGRPQQLVDLFSECRQKDTDLQSYLETREIAVKQLRIETSVGDARGSKKKPRKKDLQAAEILSDALTRCIGLPDALSHLEGSGSAFGHGTIEVRWEMRGGWLVPAEAYRVHPRRFAFRQIDGALLYDPRNMQIVEGGAGVDLMADYAAGKFVQYRPRVNGDVLTREGYARALLWAALFRNWSIADWLRLAELSWKPWRRGKYAKNADPKDITRLRTILEQMGASGVALHPDTVEIAIEWPKASAGTTSGNHQSLAEYMSRGMARCILGSADVVDASGPNGSRAATQTRGELRKDRLYAAAIGIGSLLSQQLALPFYAYNFPTARPADVLLLTDDTVDLKAFAEAMKTLRESGLQIPAKWVREQTGIPEPDALEELLGGTTDSKPDDDAAKPGAKPGAGDESDEATDGSDDPA